MLHILDEFPENRDVAYILENGVELYKIDWNGEVYLHGFDPELNSDTRYEYVPVYGSYYDDVAIIGFEERV